MCPARLQARTGSQQGCRQAGREGREKERRGVCVQQWLSGGSSGSSTRRARRARGGGRGRPGAAPTRAQAAAWTASPLPSHPPTQHPYAPPTPTRAHQGTGSGMACESTTLQRTTEYQIFSHQHTKSGRTYVRPAAAASAMPVAACSSWSCGGGLRAWCAWVGRRVRCSVCMGGWWVAGARGGSDPQPREAFPLPPCSSSSSSSMHAHTHAT